MSFCRWSSDNWHCDLYCYHHVDGYYATEVAYRRIVGDIPEANMPGPGFTDEDWAEYVKAYKTQMDFVRDAEKRKIGLDYDGCSFADATPEEWLGTLNLLRQVGYRFPDYVIEAAQEEINERAKI